MENLQQVLSPIYATIDYDAIELRPCFSLSSSLSSSNVPTMNKEDLSFQSEPYFDDDDRKFTIPRVTFTDDYHSTNNGSLWPYWESLKAGNMTSCEASYGEKNMDLYYFDENYDNEDDEPFTYF